MYFIRFFITAILISIFALPNMPAESATFKTTAQSAVLMDADTGQILYAKQEHQRKEPASLTKIITSIIAIEYGNPNEIVTIDKKAANIYVGQQIRLKQGEKITLGNLIKAALIYSANDSTVAIARHISGSEDRFIQLMNAKALLLGARNTKFANTNGYHNPNHYTTAYDLALITRYALNNKEFSDIVKTPQETIYWSDSDRKMEVKNTNRLVRNNSYPGIIGVKTGSTIRAGKCLIAAASKGERTLIAVILHSSNRFNDAVKMLDYGFDNFSEVTLCRQGEEFGFAKVNNGIGDKVKAIAHESGKAYLAPEEIPKVSKEVVFTDNLQAPIKPGDKVGEVLFSIDNKELTRIDLVSADKINKQGTLHKMRNRADNIW